MAVDGEKRFRKRGGAKKKKNKQVPESSPPDVPSGYVSGFQPSTDSALPGDLASYLTSLSTTLSELDPAGQVSAAYAANPSDEPPPPVLLATNALSELASRAPELARDNVASRVLESLLSAAVSVDAAAILLRSLLAGGAKSFGLLAAHRSASHVVCASVRPLAGLSEGEPAAALANLAEVCKQWNAEQVSEVMRSPSGSHAFRDIVAVLAGVPADEPRESKLDDSIRGRIVTYLEQMRVDVSEASAAAVCAMGTALLEGKAPLVDFVWETAACTSLQALLSGIAVSDKALAKRLALCSGEGQFSDLMRDPVGSRFIERAALCLGSSFVENEYKGQLAELASHPKANFCVQRILLGLKGRGAVMGAWDELEEMVPKMLGFGKAREGVVLSLLRATEAQGDENCRRRGSRCVARACGAVGEKTKIFVGVLVMGSEEIWSKWQAEVTKLGREGLGLYGKEGDILRVPRSIPMMSLLGALIARCIMRYPGGPGQAARDSMASLSDIEILAMAGNPIGSRLIEQWMDGENNSVSSKVAGKVVSSLSNGTDTVGLLAVAKNPYGAQVLVKCVGLVKDQKRKALMDAFASGFENLKKHDCGQMLLRKCRVEHYIRRGDEWAHEESTRETRERLFADILANDGADEGQGRRRTGRKSENEAKSEKSKKRRRLEGTVIEKVASPAVPRAGAESAAIFNSLAPTSAGGVGQRHADIQQGEREGGREALGGEGRLSSVLGAIETAAETPGKGKKKRKKERMGKGKGLS